MTATPTAPAVLHRLAVLKKPKTADEATRSIELDVASETDAGDGYILRCSADAVELPAVCPILLDHQASTDRMAGRLESIRFEAGRIIGRAVFEGCPAAEAGWQLAAGGCATSVGFQVLATKPHNRTADLATKWRLRHLALVPQGADPTAFTRSLTPALEGDSMTSTTTAAPAAVQIHDAPELERSAREIKRENAIIKMVSRAELPADFAEELVASGDSLEDCTVRLFEALKARLSPSRAGHPVTNHHLLNGANDHREQLVDQLVARCKGTGNITIRELMEGISGERGPVSMLLNRVMSTSDFPKLFAGAGLRLVRDAYEASDEGARLIARTRKVEDLRNINLLGLSEFPELKKLAEGGEITYSTFEDRGGFYRVEEFARAVKLTRRALLQDDVGAFEQAMATYGSAVALLEDDLAREALEGAADGGLCMEDGLALFTGAHANTTTATGVDLTSLAEATKLLREQAAAGIDRKLNLRPAWLLVAADEEVAARQMVATITPATAAASNPFGAGGALALQVIVDANLSGAYSYLAVSPSSAAAALELTTGPAVAEVDSEGEFETTSVKTRVLADRGLGIRDYRGIVRIAA